MKTQALYLLLLAALPSCMVAHGGSNGSWTLASVGTDLSGVNVSNAAFTATEVQQGETARKAFDFMRRAAVAKAAAGIAVKGMDVAKSVIK